MVTGRRLRYVIARAARPAHIRPSGALDCRQAVHDLRNSAHRYHPMFDAGQRCRSYLRMAPISRGRGAGGEVNPEKNSIAAAGSAEASSGRQRPIRNQQPEFMTHHQYG